MNLTQDKEKPKSQSTLKNKTFPAKKPKNLFRKKKW